MPENFENLFEENKKKDQPVYKFTKKENDGTSKECVSVCGVELPVNTDGRDCQFLEKEFEDFSLDGKSLELLEIMAKCIKLGQMPLIEGPTDIGKSKALEYLAHLTNNYLIYQSFSGQTDVSELIGKYVPNTEDAKKTFERILANKNRGTLKKETMLILESATEIGLTMEECKKIAELEGMNIDNAIEWIWQDGTVPRAMEESRGKGCWLYFDELGAAEPQILVKLNRIFTRNNKRLEITENGGREVIAGENFHLIGTTNPPSYCGREPFEKDFIRRWVYRTVSDLNQEDFVKRLNIIGNKKLNKSEKFSFNTEIINILDDVIANFRSLAQNYLDTVPKESGEQEFRFSHLSDAIRAIEYISELYNGNPTKTLKEAIEFYYMGKVYEEKKDSNNKFVKDQLMKILDEIIANKEVDKRIKQELIKLENPEISFMKDNLENTFSQFK